MLFVFLLLLPYNSNVLSRALYILCGLLLYVKKLHCWKYILSRSGFFSKKFKLFVLDCRVSDGITNGCGSGAEGRLGGRIIIVRRIPFFSFRCYIGRSGKSILFPLSCGKSCFQLLLEKDYIALSVVHIYISTHCI